jgi:hypothetical protein
MAGLSVIDNPDNCANYPSGARRRAAPLSVSMTVSGVIIVEHRGQELNTQTSVVSGGTGNCIEKE